LNALDENLSQKPNDTKTILPMEADANGR
jgi:hypothetical protein